jgi:protein tyrosine/serine phosphatase
MAGNGDDERVLALEGVHNFRDYGGYATADGGRVRRGVLWRSGQHFGASDADLDRIDALALRHVVDLRGNSERERSPCKRSTGFNAQVMFYDGETAGLAPHIEASGGVTDAASAHRAMVTLYEDIAFRPSLTSILRRYFGEALAGEGAGDGASLVHCHAGKDRTGIAVALVHHILGVHRDDMMADYLLTNTAGNNEKRIADALAQQAGGGVMSRVPEAAIRVLMNVDAAFLAAAFSSIRQRHGTVDCYLEEVLGVDATARERLCRRYIEG